MSLWAEIIPYESVYDHLDTMDTMGSVDQVIRMVEAGCEYVRITASSIKEAQNLEVIKKELRSRG
jgi:Enzyme involved in the deoxyxylulose pathway of isoprenoid biosynthesis